MIFHVAGEMKAIKIYAWENILAFQAPSHMHNNVLLYLFSNGNNANGLPIYFVVVVDKFWSCLNGSAFVGVPHELFYRKFVKELQIE